MTRVEGQAAARMPRGWWCSPSLSGARVTIRPVAAYELAVGAVGLGLVAATAASARPLIAAWGWAPRLALAVIVVVTVGVVGGVAAGLVCRRMVTSIVSDTVRALGPI